MKKITSSVWFKIFILIIVFVAGFEVKNLFFNSTLTPVIENVRQHDTSFKYIDPLLLCRITGLPTPPEFENLKTKISGLIAEAGTKIQSASVVFRDLEKSDGLGINQNDQYAPASLLKLPLMIAYLKAYESDPELLQKKLKSAESIDINGIQNYKPADSVKAGETYAIEELLKHMIVNSDNNATALLSNYMKPAQLNPVYTDLGLTVPPESLTVGFMSARLYSYFFRVLYNATYLSPELSEKAMELLVQAHFPDGIEGGVPKNISIAQKFGEREVQTTDAKTLYNELHSCGIVFYPGHPYLLCIMTKGDSFTNLSKLIQGISKMVYDEVDKENKRAWKILP